MSTVEWRQTEPGVIVPIVIGDDGEETTAAWAPQPGSQEMFLTCPVFECLYEGTRGPGKTDCLLMDFAQHCGPDRRTDAEKKTVPQTAGFGAEWRGILFRQSFPQLTDVINKTKKWFKLFFPGAKYNESKSVWTFPDGETLRLAHGQKESDYWNYHGHAYPWIAFEELTTWADPGFFRKMFSCCRSTTPGMPRKIRCTTNPYGVGHNWVKARYRLPVPDGRLVTNIIKEEGQPPRVAIHGYLDENRILLAADPHYKDNIRAAARNANELAAWLDGSWEITAGGMFDDIWSFGTHVVPQFVPPDSWVIERSFDWGSSRPFSVGWWAESDGTDVCIDGKWFNTYPGDVFRFREWYGWTGQPNEGLQLTATAVAKGIVEREIQWGIRGRVYSGPADTAIFTTENGISIARQMAQPIRIGTDRYKGVNWHRADKRPGSRKNGWELMRDRMKHAAEVNRERPGIFVTENCGQFIRTVPTLPRDLDGDPDDVAKNAEDHVADEARYYVRSRGQRMKTGRVVGVTS